MKQLTDMNATFCSIVENGRKVRCVMLKHNAEFALVRPVHRFDIMLRVRRCDLFEF